MINLSESHYDAITEVSNISINRAAAALNELVDEEIKLSVPHVAFIKRSEACRLIDLRSKASACAVTQEFSGPFSGEAFLVFPEDKSLELVRAIIGSDVPLESMGELEQDAMTEVGNIVLNASIGSIANLLE